MLSRVRPEGTIIAPPDSVSVVAAGGGSVLIVRSTPGQELPTSTPHSSKRTCSKAPQIVNSTKLDKQHPNRFFPEFSAPLHTGLHSSTSLQFAKIVLIFAKNALFRFGGMVTRQ